jgi:hypothetical protein
VVAVSVEPWQDGADFTTGGVEISWPAGDAEQRKQTLGYRLSVDDDAGKPKFLPRWQNPSVPPVDGRVRALLRGQKPGQSMSVSVEVVGRGGMVAAVGSGAGKASKAYAAVKPLEVAAQPAIETAALPNLAKGRVWAVPDLVKVNPITGNVAEEPGVAYDGEAQGHYRESNPAWSGKNGIALAGIRNEWIGFQLVCENSGSDQVAWSITAPEFNSANGAPLSGAKFRLSRTWYQKIGDGARAWYADPLVPLASGAEFSVPDGANAVAGQLNQTIYAEFYVPKDAEPGTYTGTIAVSCAGEKREVPIAVTIAAPVIPDLPAFVWSMNAYSSPGNGFGAELSPEFIAAERSFYAMGHEHRTTLAILGYSHSGNFQTGVDWPLVGSGKDMKVKDWTAWDERYGPLFDGSAFAGTTREGTAIDHFYLPFMESWPTPMAEAYKWNNLSWEEHWKVAGPVEEGFSQTAKDQWVAVMQDFARHVREKKWTTNFEVYLNDKYYYKKADNKTKKPRAGTSFWLLDEPNHVDDFSALAFFGWLTRQAQQNDRNTVHFRVDVSYPEWSRDLLDRVVDINVTGGFNGSRPLLEDWRHQHGQRIWTYGSTPPSTVSALAIERQALDLYTRGVDGFVPWLTLGEDKNWTTFADTAVFYPGKSHGVPGACASLRLKAFRRGEQDIEYVRLLGNKLGLLVNDPNRLQVAALVGKTLGGIKKLGKLDAEGAVTETFDDVKVEDFERLRRAIAAQLK